MVQFLVVDEAEQERHGKGRRRSPPPLVRIASRAFLVAVGVAWYDNFVSQFARLADRLCSCARRSRVVALLPLVAGLFNWNENRWGMVREPSW